VNISYTLTDSVTF